MPNKRLHSPERKPPVVDPISVLGFHRLGTYVLSRYRAEAKKRADGPYVPGVALEIAKEMPDVPQYGRPGTDLCPEVFTSRGSKAH